MKRDNRRHAIDAGGISFLWDNRETSMSTTQVFEDRVHVHNLHATILHQLGLEHTKLTYKFQGRYFRLTDVEGEVVKPILA